MLLGCPVDAVKCLPVGSVECVQNTVLCDGIQDCRNGYDEAICQQGMYTYRSSNGYLRPHYLNTMLIRFMAFRCALIGGDCAQSTTEVGRVGVCNSYTDQYRVVTKILTQATVNPIS